MNDLIEKLMDKIQRHCAPVFVNSTIEAPPSSVLDNGSCGFFDTGSRKLLITAQHVIQSFRDAKSDHPEAVFAINVGPGNTIALQELNVIDEDRQFLDIAILDFPDLDSCGQPCSKQYFPIQEFPCVLPVAGDALSLVGYPGFLRKANELVGSFGPVSLALSISSVSERTIVLADEKGDRRLEGKDVEGLSELPLGGFSGSPGYVLRRDGVYLAGFLRAGSKSVDQVPFSLPGVVFLSPAHYLLADGRMDRTRMPWLLA